MPGRKAGSQSQRGAAPASWALHFPGEEHSVEDRRAMLLQELVAFFGGEEGWPLLSTFQRSSSGMAVTLDYVALTEGCKSANLVAALEVQPTEGLTCLAAATCEVLFFQHEKRARRERLLPPEAKPARLAARLTNYPQTRTHISQLKSEAIDSWGVMSTAASVLWQHRKSSEAMPSLGRLVTVEGTVVRMGAIRPLVTALDFLCTKCGALVTVQLPDGQFAPPRTCGGGCRSRTFEPQRSAARVIDWQRLRVQEARQAAGGGDEGRIPRTVEVELRRDLVGATAAGDAVTVMGLVRATNAEADAGAKAKGAGALFLLYLEAVSVVTSRRAAHPLGNTPRDVTVPGAAPEFTLRQLHFVVKFAQECAGRQFRQLVHALCPGIYGQELVKAGIVLALLGGAAKPPRGPDQLPVRCDIHVLLCGDPGLGKSQLLQAAAAAAPRGLYLCGGMGTTAAGLTAAVVRDAATGEAALEAGAVALADGGVCCLDEFDKMAREHQALLCAMEQQEVAVTKAGLCASLAARCAVLAAANPVGGRYSRAKTIHENLKMSAAMLSRFDLVFLLMDRPDAALDQRLSEHIMAVHSGQAERLEAARQKLLAYRASQGPGVPLLGGEGLTPGSQQTLEERLTVPAGEAEDTLPMQLLRTFIAYARTYVQPRLDGDAKQVLKEFYLGLRARAAASAESAPITTRHLEALVRLTEARARADLAPLATRAHAEDAVALMRDCLLDKLLDETGVLDFRRAGGRSEQGEAKRFLGALDKRCRAAGRSQATLAEMRRLADDLSLNVRDLDSFLERLNDAGELLKKGPDLYEVRCALGGGGGAGRSYSALAAGSLSRS